ncbi:Mnd1 family-domain-containing protein [Boeremia exigua]|uniref:Mnd1 family-domain-containing protein n=1 Tax=Boeremia exigua TaxID=749465 RepID=UPI001E8E2F61|nr:Mnd1 family-domain-containing protein [Boeremia exigua]KAH6612637.1 Mnd1 family-domain-containing protein [Boeremia exigua]
MVSHFKCTLAPLLTSQAPKTIINTQKQAAILAWLQKTALAYSLKDLEKLVPSVTSINGMAVKDYMQALQDDSQINAEKIGNGNWYWCFPSEAKKKKETALAKAQEEHDKANATAAELQAKVDLAGAAQAEDEELLAETAGEDRKTLIAKHDELTKEVEKLRKELAAYSEYDPVELDKKIEEIRQSRAAAEKFTEHIYCMESWLKARVPDRESQIGALKEIYGDEWDDEDGGLREL